MDISKIQKRNRFDYILIWGHGLKYTDEILEILNTSKDIEIIHLVKHKSENIEDLVNAIYSYDYAPIEHLRNKTLYLKTTPPEVLFVFIKNNNSNEIYIGENEYRHIECTHIKIIKEKIRNLYNPKENGQRTENHVVHASDNQLQTEHILSYLNIHGTSLFSNKPNSIIDVPFHIKTFNSFELKKISYPQLFARIIVSKGKSISHKIVSIEETPHYQYLCGKKHLYNSYIEEFRGNFLNDNHTQENLQRLSEKFNYSKYLHQTNYILCEKHENKYIVLDGVHRASVLKFQNIKNLIVAIVN